MNHRCMDFGFELGPDFDEFAAGAKEAARDFAARMRDAGAQARAFFEDECASPLREGRARSFYGFPPFSSYKRADGALVLQFALAGVEESSVKTAFVGDYLVLSARFPAGEEAGSAGARRGYRPRNVERQKYLVPAEDYEQAAATATLKAGLLTVTVPAKGISDADAVRITIVKEGS